METIKEYIESMFKKLPQNEKVIKAKNELLQMMEDKYEELKSEGKSENESIGTVISEFGNLEELAIELGISDEINDKKDSSKTHPVSLEIIKEYLLDSKKRILMSSIATALVLLGVAFLVCDANWGKTGLILFFVCLAANIGLRKYLTYGFSKFKTINKDECSLGASGKSFIKNEKNNNFSKLITLRTVGNVLCVLCVIPLFALGNTVLDDFAFSGLFIILAVAVFLKKYAKHIGNVYDKLLGMECDGIWYQEPVKANNSEVKYKEHDSNTKSAVVMDIIRTLAVVVLVIFIILGGRHIFNYCKNFVNNFAWDNETYETSEWNGENNESFDINQDFNKIVIDGKIMEVSVTGGSEPNLKVKYKNENFKPDVIISNKTLKVVQNCRNTGNNNSSACVVELTVPENKIYSLDINCNVSEIDVSDLQFNNVEIKSNVGSIDIENVIFEELKAKTNVGEINLEMEDSLSDYNVSASANVGEINVMGREYKKSYNSKDSNNSKTIKLETNVGEISID